MYTFSKPYRMKLLLRSLNEKVLSVCEKTYGNRPIILLLLIYTLPIAVHSANIEKECQPKSNLEVKPNRHNIDLSVWVPPEEKLCFLEIIVKFVEPKFPYTYDTFNLCKNQINITKIRENKKTNSEKVNLSITDGWANFNLDWEGNYSLTYHQSKARIALNISVYFNISSVEIVGSNVTVDCKSDKLVWNSSKTPVSVPLDNSKIHRLSFYADSPFMPEIQFGGLSFKLGIDNGSLTTNPEKQTLLPAEKEIHMKFECSEANDCKLMNDNNGGKTVVWLEYKPKIISFTHQQNRSYFIFFDTHNPSSDQKRDTNSSSEWFYEMTLFGSIITTAPVTFFATSVLYIWKPNLLKNPFRSKSSYKNVHQNDETVYATPPSLQDSPSIVVKSEH